ncbi:MAG: anti-sigma factor [Candidatus Zixiibacteriota bacterium]|nr:MAG: anti-sigma factor [candidate division Zixibacteria bacterium]
MFKRNKLFILLILPLLSILPFWGCEQPEDVLTPITETTVWLTANKLPTNPDGMVYELWVANSTDSVPIEKFGYDFVSGRFLETDGSVRSDSNEFLINYDLLDFTTIFVSVERNPDDNSNSPGAIMLYDLTVSETIKMRFPKMDSLWAASVWYNMESPSDGAPGGIAGLDPTTDGYAVWFSSYIEMLRPLNDTLGIFDWSVAYDTLEDYTGPEEMIVVIGIDDNSIVTKDTARVFGLDLIEQKVTRFDILLDTITEPPYVATVLTINYDVYESNISFDNFNQGQDNEEFGLPVLTDFGWRYKGWVVSPYIDSDAITSRMTMPAWQIIGIELDETDGAMLSTGVFGDVRYPDESNPYVASARIPPYPGEDFLMNLPDGIAPVCLVPNENGNPGRVFISLEPINAVSTATNFPLIPFLGELPESRSMVTDGNLTQRFVLQGWMQDLSDPYRGFPWIGVRYERF